MVTTRSSRGPSLERDTLALRSRTVASPASLRKRKALGDNDAASPAGKRRRNDHETSDVTTAASPAAGTETLSIDPHHEGAGGSGGSGGSGDEMGDLGGPTPPQDGAVPLPTSDAVAAAEDETVKDEEQAAPTGALGEEQPPATERTRSIVTTSTSNTHVRFDSAEPAQEEVTLSEVQLQKVDEPEVGSKELVSDDEAPEVVSTQVAVPRTQFLPRPTKRKGRRKTKSKLVSPTLDSAVLTEPQSETLAVAVIEAPVSAVARHAPTQTTDLASSVAPEALTSLTRAPPSDPEHHPAGFDTTQTSNNRYETHKVQATTKSSPSARHVTVLPPMSNRSSQVYKAQMLSHSRTEHRWKGSRPRFFGGVRV